MAVFLTGGTGYLGQSLVRTLRARGKEVRALVRPSSRTEGLDLDRIETTLGDVRDPAGVRAAMAGCRAVVHLASETSPSAGQRECDETNLSGFRNVMDAAYGNEVPIVIHVSCFLALGPTSGTIADEGHRTAARRSATPFERSLRAAESLVRSYRSGGLPLVVVYPGLLYGPGPVRGGNLVSRLIVTRAKGGLSSLPADPDQRVSLAYVDDVSEGICRALERAKPGDRFVLGGENLSFLEIFQVLQRVSGLIAPKPARSLVAAGARARVAGWGARITGRTRTWNRLTRDLMRNDWAYSSLNARDLLSYTIRPPKDGMKKTVDYLVREGLLS